MTACQRIELKGRMLIRSWLPKPLELARAERRLTGAEVKTLKKCTGPAIRWQLKLTALLFIHVFFFVSPSFLLAYVIKRKPIVLTVRVKDGFECVLLLRGGGHDHPLKNAQLIRQIIRQITDWVIGQMSAEGERMGTDETFAEKEFGRLTDKWRRQWRSTFMFKIKV